MTTPTTAPRQLIARFEPASVATDDRGTGGAILVFLIPTNPEQPTFRIVIDGGELPEGVRPEYLTAKAAIRTAADLALCTIYDECVDITETGEEDEDLGHIEPEAGAAVQS